VSETSHSRAEHYETAESQRLRLLTLKNHLQKERRRRGVVAEVCVKCTYGNRQYDEIFAKPLQECFALLEREIGRSDPRAIAKMVHKHYKHEIFLKMAALGKAVPMWRTRTIYEHLMQHDNEPRIRVWRQLRIIDKLQNVLVDETHTVDKETGEVKPDIQTIKTIVDLMKVGLQMSTTNVKNMFGYDDKAAIDVGKALRQNATDKQSAVRGRFSMRAVSSKKMYRN
jgi:hypothetical protein